MKLAFKFPKLNLQKKILFLAVLLAVCFAGYAGWTVYQRSVAEANTFVISNEKALSMRDVLKTSLGADETWGTPNVSKVTNPDKLKESDATFFANVEKSDLILVFQEKKKVVIFRESTNAVVQFGDLLDQ